MGHSRGPGRPQAHKHHDGQIHWKEYDPVSLFCMAIGAIGALVFYGAIVFVLVFTAFVLGIRGH